MAITGHGILSTGCHLLPLRAGHGSRQRPSSATTISIRCANKRDPSENPESDRPILPSFRVSSPVLARSALAAFALGFIDAGYSGDWSRIGAISKEAEDLLRVAAFVVVPLCIFAIISFSEEQDA